MNYLPPAHGAPMTTTLIDSVANTTFHRDRDDLDHALATLLLQFLSADAVTLYRLAEDGDSKQIKRGITATRGSDEHAPVQLASTSELPAWDSVPAWRECITEHKAVQYSPVNGMCGTVFPIASERAVVGMLEIEGRASLQERDAQLVAGILRIVRNHLALLDYGESDTLTGLLNRKTFESRFDKLRTGSGVVLQEEPSWLGLVDIDRFKSINDNYGHLFGDEVLLLVARLLKQAFRGGDQLFRFGGEEFVIVLDRASTPGAQIAFNRLRTLVDEFRFPQVGKVTISLGYTRVDAQDTPSICVARADAALYYAKHHGRNNVQSYEALIASGELKAKKQDVDDVELF
jgi:diguanylate cyclase (GGDEF)-like protein